MGSYIKTNDILVHTSIKEATSSAILEGMQNNLPFIAHDAFGISHLVKRNLGFGIEYKNFETSISGFRNTLEKIIMNKSSLEDKFKNIQKFKHLFTYQNMAKDISESYLEVLK